MGGNKIEDGRAFPDDLRAQMEQDAGMGVSADAEESRPTTDDEFDPLKGISFGPTLLERLVLSLIDAHPSDDGAQRGTRLKTAIQAITGRELSDAPLPRRAGDNGPDKEKEEQVLLWMADQALQYKAKKKKTISVNKLSELAANKFYYSVDKNNLYSKKEHLRHKYNGKDVINKAKKLNEILPDMPNTLKYRISQHDYLRESIENQILIRILLELRQAAVPVSLPDEE
ncbi:hypothetical protein [Asticcacaulis taihuensis]|nr:hypothetical protein [Asticcacaulis taihuensis]